MTQALLLSVRPRFAHALLNGSKTVEVRRRFPEVAAGTAVVVYSSSPEKAVLGTLRVRHFARTTAEEFWRLHSATVGIGRAELMEYLDGTSWCSALEVEAPNAWTRHVPLDELRLELKLEPAQSFRYLDSRQYSRLLQLAEAPAGP